VKFQIKMSKRKSKLNPRFRKRKGRNDLRISKNIIEITSINRKNAKERTNIIKIIKTKSFKK
jgi:hypothetical protein